NLQLVVIHREAFELGGNRAALPGKILDSVFHLFVLRIVAAISLIGRLVALDAAVLGNLAEREVQEGIVHGPAERNDVLDIKLGLRAEKTRHGYGFAGIGTLPAAFLGEKKLAYVHGFGLLDTGVLDDLACRIGAGLFIPTVVLGDGFPLLLGLFQVARELNVNLRGSAVLADNGVRHFP